MRLILYAGIAAATLSAISPAYAADKATARMIDADGAEVGTVELSEIGNGVLLHARLQGLPPGPHGFHLHAVGRCEAPFESAGGHFNPRATPHGFRSAGGGHIGDMPNLHVPESGAVEVEVLVLDTRLSQASLLDSDGIAIVVHAEPDDYATDPAGNAGKRIACGVVKP